MACLKCLQHLLCETFWKALIYMASYHEQKQYSIHHTTGKFTALPVGDVCSCSNIVQHHYVTQNVTKLDWKQWFYHKIIHLSHQNYLSHIFCNTIWLFCAFHNLCRQGVAAYQSSCVYPIPSRQNLYLAYVFDFVTPERRLLYSLFALLNLHEYYR